MFPGDVADPHTTIEFCLVGMYICSHTTVKSTLGSQTPLGEIPVTLSGGVVVALLAIALRTTLW